MKASDNPYNPGAGTPPPELAGRQSILNQAAPIRDELIKKGMAYSPRRGLVDFTVPKFDEFIKRKIP